MHQTSKQQQPKETQENQVEPTANAAAAAAPAPAPEPPAKKKKRQSRQTFESQEANNANPSQLQALIMKTNKGNIHF